MRKNLLFLLAVASAAFSLTACNSTSIGVSDFRNPAPDAAFSQYDSFELQPVSMGAPYAGQNINEKAKAKLQEELDVKLKPVVDSWNTKSTGSGNTLVIEPRIHEIKFVSGATRFWGGAIAGDSAVVVKVAFRDKQSGKLIAEPEFYQHANAWGAAYSVGGTDKAMLNRLATLVMEYAERNYASAVGGPTGKPEPTKR